MVLRPDPSLCLGALRKAGESEKLGVGKAKDASSTWTASSLLLLCLLQEMCRGAKAVAFHITVFPPSLPGHRASPALPGSSTWTLVLQVSGSPFGAGTPPNPSFPSFISLTIWHCSRGLQNTLPRESLKGLIIVWDSLLIVLISSFHSCVPVATGSPCECLVIPTDTGTWCCLKREGAAKLPPEIPLLLPLLHRPAQARIRTKQVSLSVHGGEGIK